MKKCIKVGNETFLCLQEQTLWIDCSGSTTQYAFPIDLTSKILDFDFEETTRTLRAFTTDGQAVTTPLDTPAEATAISFDQIFISASIYDLEVLAITAEFKPFLLDFKGNIVQEYPEIVKQVRYCLLNGTLKALADSSVLYVRKSRTSAWEKHKFRDFFIKSLMNVNRHMEFGLTTSQNTRIVRNRFQSVFRGWAKDSVSLLQCPSSRHFYAHLDKDGLLRIGDNDSDFSLQEMNCSGICWDLGVLWSRNLGGEWHRVVLAFNDELYDLRCVKLDGMERPLKIEDSGKVIDVLETLKERPTMSKEVLKVLPAIAQDLRDGLYIQEAKVSLDVYIKKSEAIQEVLGQIELVLSSGKK
jgi:hypothetical protein